MAVYTVIDFETTGLDYKTEQVIEIAALKVNEDFEEIGRFSTFVRLEKELPSFITELTNITENDLVHGLQELSALYLLKGFIDDSTVVAQNAPFDLSFLCGDLYKEPKYFVCTRAMTKLNEPNESPSLKPTCERHGIQLEGHHRAMNDVKATLEIFKIMKEKSERNGISYLNTVIDTPKRPLTFIPKNSKVIKLEK